MKLLTAFLSGIIFSIGLVISGMINPNKVLGFLDIFGQWDYALIFVMVGAIAVNALLYHMIVHRESPLLDIKFHLPTKKEIDRRLLIGAALFGIGWGMAGICPGPAIVNLPFLHEKILVFVLFMLVGMFLFYFYDKIKNKGS